MAAVLSLLEGSTVRREGPTMMWGWQGWSWWGWLGMSFGMLAFWGLVIWGIVAIFRGWGGSSTRRERPDPEQILAERFAAGEIDEDEYQQRLRTLRSSRHDAWQHQR
jgi:putative membrane protein